MPPPPTAAPGVLHTFLQLLAEAYRRTLQLADKLHDAGGADVKTKVRGCRHTVQSPGWMSPARQFTKWLGDMQQTGRRRLLLFGHSLSLASTG